MMAIMGIFCVTVDLGKSPEKEAILCHCMD